MPGQTETSGEHLLCSKLVSRLRIEEENRRMMNATAGEDTDKRS